MTSVLLPMSILALIVARLGVALVGALTLSDALVWPENRRPVERMVRVGIGAVLMVGSLVAL